MWGDGGGVGGERAAAMGLLVDVFPLVGVGLANALFFAPLPGVASAVRSGSLGAFNPLPQAVMLLSTGAWVMYSLSVANSYIFIANAPGCVASLGSYVATLPLIRSAETRRSVQIIVTAGVALKIALAGGLVFGRVSEQSRSFVLGLYGSVLCVVMFAAPLSTVFNVIATADSSSIYAPLTLAQVLNCGTWTAYGIAIGDIWVWAPNGCGLVLGLVQALLKLIYPEVAANIPRRSILGEEAKALVHSTKGLTKATSSDNDEV